MDYSSPEFITLSALIVADFWDYSARQMHQRRAHWDNLWAVDTQSPSDLFNNATLIRPHAPWEAEQVAAQVAAFYSGSAGGGYALWDAWQTLDLRPYGLKPNVNPCMVREPGGAIPPSPPELEIVEARDAAALAEFEYVVLTSNGVSDANRWRPGSVWDTRVPSEAYRFWVGRVDERPVATALAFRTHEFNFVGWVATVPAMRRRGYGEAVTWRATLANPTLPAILHASSMGEPLYRRMGYRVVAQLTIWTRPTRTG